MNTVGLIGNDIYCSLDEQYYSMPVLFELDEWSGCVALQNSYCVGSFDLTPEQNDTHQLYDMMKVGCLYNQLTGAAVLNINNIKYMSLYNNLL